MLFYFLEALSHKDFKWLTVYIGMFNKQNIYAIASLNYYYAHFRVKESSSNNKTEA